MASSRSDINGNNKKPLHSKKTNNLKKQKTKTKNKNKNKYKMRKTFM